MHRNRRKLRAHITRTTLNVIDAFSNRSMLCACLQEQDRTLLLDVEEPARSFHIHRHRRGRESAITHKQADHVESPTCLDRHEFVTHTGPFYVRLIAAVGAVEHGGWRQAFCSWQRLGQHQCEFGALEASCRMFSA